MCVAARFGNKSELCREKLATDINQRWQLPRTRRILQCMYEWFGSTAELFWHWNSQLCQVAEVSSLLQDETVNFTPFVSSGFFDIHNLWYSHETWIGGTLASWHSCSGRAVMEYNITVPIQEMRWLTRICSRSVKPHVTEHITYLCCLIGSHKVAVTLDKSEPVTVSQNSWKNMFRKRQFYSMTRTGLTMDTVGWSLASWISEHLI